MAPAPAGLEATHSSGVASVTVTPDTLRLAVGETKSVSCVVRKSSGAIVQGKACNWKSLNLGVATTTDARVASAPVTGRAPGTTEIQAAAGGHRDRAVVIVSGTAPPPEEPPAEGCVRDVNVSTSAQLAAAGADARPGDCIRLADGVYSGWFRFTNPGTAAAPITLSGSRAAIIDGGGLTLGGYALQLWTSYWVVDGITVRNRLQGIEIRGGSHNVIRNTQCHEMGQECLHLWANSRDNVVEGNWIHDTGRYRSVWGEGVYLGSAQSKWSAAPLNGPDRTDDNIIRRNHIGPNVTAEHIDAKAGTTGNRLEQNTYDGRGQTTSGTTYIDSWVEINGNDYVVVGETGSAGLKYGWQTYRVNLTDSGANCSPGASGCVAWGLRTLYDGNHADKSGVSAAAAIVFSNGATGTVKCNNTRAPSTLPLISPTSKTCVP
jgi:hypothetical protein